VQSETDWSIASEGNRLGCCKQSQWVRVLQAMKIGWGVARMVISWVGLLQANGNELMVLQAKKTRCY